MLTNGQKTVINADMLARPELATLVQTGDDGALALFYSTIQPDFYVFKTAIQPAEYKAAIRGNAFEAMTTHEFNQWAYLTGYGNQPIDPSQANVRELINNTFSNSNTAVQDSRDALQALWKRPATLVEKLLATGDGTEANPAVMSYEGALSAVDASESRVYTP